MAIQMTKAELREQLEAKGYTVADLDNGNMAIQCDPLTVFAASPAACLYWLAETHPDLGLEDEDGPPDIYQVWLEPMKREAEGCH